MAGASNQNQHRESITHSAFWLPGQTLAAEQTFAPRSIAFNHSNDVGQSGDSGTVSVVQQGEADISGHYRATRALSRGGRARWTTDRPRCFASRTDSDAVSLTTIALSLILGRRPRGVQIADYEASDSVPLRCVVSILALMAAPSETLIAGAEIPPSIEAVAMTTIFVVAHSSPLTLP
jgi:hypothetical protein